MEISTDLKVHLVDLISIAMPHLQRLPSRQPWDIIYYSISAVSDDARSVQQDLTLVNTEAVIESKHFPVFQVLLTGASLHHP